MVLCAYLLSILPIGVVHPANCCTCEGKRIVGGTKVLPGCRKYGSNTHKPAELYIIALFWIGLHGCNPKPTEPSRHWSFTSRIQRLQVNDCLLTDVNLRWTSTRHCLDRSSYYINHFHHISSILNSVHNVEPVERKSKRHAQGIVELAPMVWRFR